MFNNERLYKTTWGLVLAFMPLLSLAFYINMWSATVGSIISSFIILAYVAVPVFVLDKLNQDIRSFNIYAHRLEGLIDILIPWQKNTIKPDLPSIERELISFIIISIIVLIPYALIYCGYFYYKALLLNKNFGFSLHWPENFLNLVLIQVFVVALPEEIFWRGFVQGTLLKKWPNEYSLKGFPLGRAVIITNLLFAVAHFMVGFMPARLLTFFPGLVFSALVLRHKSLLSAILFHALCNIFAQILFLSVLLR